MPTLVYMYGLLEPTIHAERVVDQMRLAHRYRNLLVEIEHERRAKVREALATHSDVAPLEQSARELGARMDAARDRISVARAAARSRTPKDGEQYAADIAEIKEITPLLRVARAQARDAKRAVKSDAAVAEKMTAADEHSKQRIRDARAVCGVYWGTYLLQESAADQARKSLRDPRFQAWRGEGRVSVQLQGGLSLEELLGGAGHADPDRADPDPAGAPALGARPASPRAASPAAPHRVRSAPPGVGRVARDPAP